MYDVNPDLSAIEIHSESPQDVSSGSIGSFGEIDKPISLSNKPLVAFNLETESNSRFSSGLTFTIPKDEVKLPLSNQFAHSVPKSRHGEEVPAGGEGVPAQAPSDHTRVFKRIERSLELLDTQTKDLVKRVEDLPTGHPLKGKVESIRNPYWDVYLANERLHEVDADSSIHSKMVPFFGSKYDHNHKVIDPVVIEAERLERDAYVEYGGFEAAVLEAEGNPKSAGNGGE